MKSKIIKSNRNLKIYNYLQQLNSISSFSSFVFDSLFHQFINKLMKHGNKSSSLFDFVDCLIIIKNITRISPLYVFRTAIFNVKPLISVKNITRGKRIMYEPRFCSVKEQIKKSISFIVSQSNLLKNINKSLSVSQRLAISILNCFFKQGDAYMSVLKIHYALRNRRFKFLKSLTSHLYIHIKRRKKMKGYYHQNRNSLFRKLQYVKSY